MSCLCSIFVPLNRTIKSKIKIDKAYRNGMNRGTAPTHQHIVTADQESQVHFTSLKCTHALTHIRFQLISSHVYFNYIILIKSRVRFIHKHKEYTTMDWLVDGLGGDNHYYLKWIWKHAIDKRDQQQQQQPKPMQSINNSSNNPNCLIVKWCYGQCLYPILSIQSE